MKKQKLQFALASLHNLKKKQTKLIIITIIIIMTIIKCPTKIIKANKKY